MMHIIVGLFLIALGIWGVFDQYYYISDFFKGAGPLILILFGLVATLAGVVGPAKKENSHDEETKKKNHDEGTLEEGL